MSFYPAKGGAEKAYDFGHKIKNSGSDKYELTPLNQKRKTLVARGTATIELFKGDDITSNNYTVVRPQNSGGYVEVDISAYKHVLIDWEYTVNLTEFYYK